jgi:hypothetical protein
MATRLYHNFPVNCYNPLPCLRKVLFEEDAPLQPFWFVNVMFRVFPFIMLVIILTTIVVVHLLWIWISDLSLQHLLPGDIVEDEATEDLDRFATLMEPYPTTTEYCFQKVNDEY